MPPMGYYKNKLNDKIVIMDEPAEIVREIYTMYIDGFGFKAIAEKLNKDGKNHRHTTKSFITTKIKAITSLQSHSGICGTPHR